MDRQITHFVGDTCPGGHRTPAGNILTDHPRDVSLKRAAWAYGCAKKGSEEEQQLLVVLLAKVKTLIDPKK